MRSASVAEWIVGRFTSKKRATSVVGDLVELQPQKGLLWFWASLGGIVVSLSWRRIFGFVVAFCAERWILDGSSVTAVFGFHGHLPVVQLWHPWGIVLGLLILVSPFLWMTLMYAAIRYGLQDKVTQLTFASTGLTTAIIFYNWQPVILFVCVALSSWVTVVSILKRERRKAALVLLVTLITGLISVVPTLFLAVQYMRFVFYSGPMRTIDLHDHASLRWVFFCIELMVTWITVSACSHMHHWLLRDEPLDEETEEGLA